MNAATGTTWRTSLRASSSRLARGNPLALAQPGTMKIWPVFPVTTVGALIERADGEILLVRTHEWRDELGVPGGKGTYGERLEVALHRQVKEETGLEICDVRFILAQEAVPRARLPAWKRGSRKSHLAYAPPLIAVAGASNPLAVRKHELLK